MNDRTGDSNTTTDSSPSSRDRNKNRRRQDERRRPNEITKNQPVPVPGPVAQENLPVPATKPPLTSEESSPEPMQDKLKELETLVDRKDELIVALTDQLEQAAEQLDRLHRTGADRGVRMASGIPAELIETQKTLAEDLQNSLRLWDEAQAASTLGRIEMRLDEIRQLVVQSLENPLIERADHGRTPPPNPSREVPVSRENRPNPNDKQTPKKQQRRSPSPGDSYESIKAQLLEGAEEKKEDDAPPEVLELEAAPALVELPPAPSSVDLETADEAQLRNALEERDTFIQALLARFRTSRPAIPVDWSALTAAPQELVAHLRQLQVELQESLKVSEVELSLERAKLSRVELRLSNWEKQLERREKNPSSSHDSSSAQGGASAEKKRNTRWLRMFGKEDEK